MVKKTPTPSKEVIALNAKIAELEENYKRVLADYQNQERRFKEVQSQFIKYANATLLEKILSKFQLLL